jgi:hypothetical protein
VSTARHTDGSVDGLAAAGAPRALDAEEPRLLLAPANTRHRLRGGGHAGDLARSFEHGDAALLERLATLRKILPTMATEVAIARREGARLRCENAKLRDLLARAPGSLPVGMVAAASAAEGEAR